MRLAVIRRLSEAGQFMAGALGVLWCLVCSLLWWTARWFLSALRLKQASSLRGEVVLVTGAGSGVGQHVALRLAGRGCRIVLLGKQRKDLAATVEMLQQRGLGSTEVFAYGCDCGSEASVRDAVRQIEADLPGKVTVLVNNAGVVHSGHFQNLPADGIRDTVAVNLLGHFWLTQALLPTLKRQRRSHIVCIASVAGLFGASGLSSYCASKFGVVGMCESLAMDLHLEGQEHVKVTCVCPYQINTNMFAGVKLRYPWLFPVLDVQYVAERVVDCFFSDRHLIIMPRTMYLLAVMKPLLPHSVMLKASDFLGITSAMENTVAGGKRD